jgi:hypothetical protein
MVMPHFLLHMANLLVDKISYSGTPSTIAAITTTIPPRESLLPVGCQYQ